MSNHNRPSDYLTSETISRYCINPANEYSHMKLLYVYLLYPKRKQAGEQYHIVKMSETLPVCVCESRNLYASFLFRFERCSAPDLAGTSVHTDWIDPDPIGWSEAIVEVDTRNLLRRRHDEGLWRTTIHVINLYLYIYRLIYYYRNYLIGNFLYCFGGLNCVCPLLGAQLHSWLHWGVVERTKMLLF